MQEYIVYHKDQAQCPELHVGGPYFFQPSDWNEGEIYSPGYATEAEAIDAAEQWATEQEWEQE